jgi:hypothetical protein
MIDKDLKGVLGLGGIVAIGVATSFIIRAYLDILRIKKIKQELKQETNQ